jgi:sugar lactone lactonase YvrE
MKITRIGNTVDRLGEGPIWDAQTLCLYWLDSLAGTLHRLDPETGSHQAMSVPSPVGSMSLRAGGGAVLSLQDGFYSLDFDTGSVMLLASLGIEHPNVRLNDGKTDRQGRFLAGTMHLHRADDEPVVGGLYRLASGGKAVRVAEDILTSNGPCFSPDGRIFYFADSTRRVIWAFDYDTESGTPHNRRVFADLGDMNTSPDGATVDGEGHVWSALVRSGSIARFDPTGRMVQRIEMPVLYPTSLAFGGKNLDVLYVTSISRSVRFADEHQDAGGLFAIEGLGILGLAEPRCVV